MFLKNIFGGGDDGIRPKLIQYNFPDNSKLVHKEGGYPILQDSQLIVGPSQTVIMVRNGQIYKRFDSGAQVLDTGVLRSVIKQYEKIYEGGENGVPVDLYFINNLFSDALPWGTPDPIQIIDPVLDLYIKIVANGQLRYQITDPELYIITNMSEDISNLNRVCKQKVLAHFSAAVQSYVQTEKLGYFEIAANTVKMSERLRDILNAKLVGEEGFRIVDFTISGFHADEKDLEILQKAKNEAYDRKAKGISYQEERNLDIMEQAVNNQGALGGMMGTMMGATLGMNMGNMLGNQFNNQFNNNMNNMPQNNAPSGAVCPSCGAAVAAGAKFCGNCGFAIPAAEKFCLQCGSKLAPGTKFCGNCGAKQV